MTTGAGALEGFGVTVNFGGDQVVLGVRGEVDILTAPELAAVVDAVIDRGHVSVVLDLAEMTFMDASGLEVIASGVRRLAPLGGEVVLRSTPALAIRIIDITGLNEVVSFEQPESAPDHLGREQSVDVTNCAPTFEIASAPQQLRRVTSIPADDDVVDGALRLVVALAQATVEGADGVSVSLQRHGRLTTVAATDQTISDMDADQYATGEGPCVDASVKGHWFHAESLDAETRWPSFIPKAQELGINSILSNPLLTADRPVGALNIYSRTAQAFSAKEQELASIFAAEASTILRDAGVDISEAELSQRFGEALRTRQVIALAQGVVMERQGISEEDAYAVLLDSSRQDRKPLREGATEIVSSTWRPTSTSISQTRSKP